MYGGSPARFPEAGLDAPPPSPPPTPLPGDDTIALLGAPNTNPAGGASVNTPMGRVLRGLSSLMNGINDIEGVVPGSVPPPFVQLVAQLTQSLPEIVRSMTMSPGPQSLLAAAAASQPGAMPGSGTGMGMGMINPGQSQQPSGMEGLVGRM